jgi:dihydrodipicolinate synthase/N-acetylneuraminate lyase
LIELLAELGYPVVFVRPGRNLAATASDAEVAANMQPFVTAAAGSGLAVGVYSIPDVSGLPLTPIAAAMLVNGPGGDRLVAIKVTEANYDLSTLQFLKHPDLKHLKIVQGWDPHLARALQDGPRFDLEGRQRCGVTSGPMSFAVHQYLHLLGAAERGDWSEVEAAQAAVTALFQAMQDDPRKFADLQRAKFLMGLGHPLTGTVSEEQVERVFQAFEQLPRVEDRTRLARSLDLMS